MSLLAQNRLAVVVKQHGFVVTLGPGQSDRNLRSLERILDGDRHGLAIQHGTDELVDFVDERVLEAVEERRRRLVADTPLVADLNLVD